MITDLSFYGLRTTTLGKHFTSVIHHFWEMEREYIWSFQRSICYNKGI